MKIFLDTANVEQIREAAGWGILDGVTTNPTLIARERRSLEDVVAEIVGMVDGPISVEVIARDTEGMVREGRMYADIHRNIVVKCPMTVDGLRATKTLTGSGVKVNATLIFSVSQALLAAKAGAWCVSPFVGRLDDISHSGMDLVRQIIQVFRNYRMGTLLLAASIRSPPHVVECALAGADIATMPFPVLERLVRHPLTDIGLERFMNDWKRLQQELGK